MKKKKVMLLILIIAMMLMTVGCSLLPTESPIAKLEIEEGTTQEETTTVSENEEESLLDEAGSYTELMSQVETAVSENNIDFLADKLRYAAEDGTYGQFPKEQVQDFVDYMNGFPEYRDRMMKKLTEGALYSAKLEDAYIVALPVINLQITTDMEETHIVLDHFEGAVIGPIDTYTCGPLLPMEYRVVASNDGWSGVRETKVNVDLSSQNIPVQFSSGEQSVHTGGHMIAIDAAGQKTENEGEETITGVVSGIHGYELTLTVAEELKKELVSRGYEVVMIRESNDVNISTSARTEVANASGAEINVRLQAAVSDDPLLTGARAIAPTTENPGCGGIAEKSQILAQKIMDGYCAATGVVNLGVKLNDNNSSINGCQLPVTVLKLGYMSNMDEDLNMASETFQKNAAAGIADGIDGYFNNGGTDE